MTDEQGHDEQGRFVESHGGAGLMRRAAEGRPWPIEAQQELVEAQHELSTPTGRRSVKNLTAAQKLVVVNHYYLAWEIARAKGDEKGMQAAMNVYTYVSNSLGRDIVELDKSDNAPGPSAAQVLDSLRGKNEQRD